MFNDVKIIEDKKEELLKSFYEIFQGRSNYQIENFVINSNFTDERRYAQCVLELQNKYYSIKRADITRRRLKKEIENETCPFNIEEKMLDIEQVEIALYGALREFDILYKLFKSFPKYTNEQLQEGETKYWIERLVTQAQQDIESQGTISAGNAEALRQANLLNGYYDRFMEIMSSSSEKIPSIINSNMKKIKDC